MLRVYDDLQRRMVRIWICSHDSGHIWEEILPHPSELMLKIFKELERQ